MATTVPTLVQDTAEVDVATGRRRISATPDAAGAQVGRALQQAGQTIGAVAEDKLDEYERAQSLELDNQLARRMRQRLRGDGVNPGYLSTQRRAAIDERAQAEADIDAMAAEIAGTTSNARVRAMFLRSARQRVEEGLGQIASHAATENDNYLNEQSQSRLLEFADDAAAAYADEAAVLGYIQGADQELANAGRRLGWDDATLSQRQRQFRSDVIARTITLLASTDPEAAEDLLVRARPELTAREAAELQTTLRYIQRQTEEAVVDEAWEFVAANRRVPEALWNRLPGRSRIDIQNEQRRRAEGGSRTGNRELIEDLRVEAAADPDAFARRDLRSIRGELGSAYDDLAIAQAEIRNGSSSSDVAQVRTNFNALRDTAATTLGIDLTPTERTPNSERTMADAFNAALLREVEGYMAANPGQGIGTEDAQILIGRAWVGMRGSDVSRDQGRVQGDRGRTRTRRERRGGPRRPIRVMPTTEVNVPYARIPLEERTAIERNLALRGVTNPSQGEVENAYAAWLSRQTIQIGGE